MLPGVAGIEDDALGSRGNAKRPLMAVAIKSKVIKKIIYKKKKRLKDWKMASSFTSDIQLGEKQSTFKGKLQKYSN